MDFDTFIGTHCVCLSKIYELADKYYTERQRKEDARDKEEKKIRKTAWNYAVLVLQFPSEFALFVSTKLFQDVRQSSNKSGCPDGFPVNMRTVLERIDQETEDGTGD